MPDNPKADEKKDDQNDDRPVNDILQKDDPANESTGEILAGDEPEQTESNDAKAEAASESTTNEIVDFDPGDESKRELLESNLYKAELDRTKSSSENYTDTPEKSESKTRAPSKGDSKTEESKKDAQEIQPFVPRAKTRMFSGVSNRQLIIAVVCFVLVLLFFSVFNPFFNQHIGRAAEKPQFDKKGHPSRAISGELLRKLTEEEKIQSSQLLTVHSDKTLNVNLEQLEAQFNYLNRPTGDLIPEFATLTTRDGSVSRSIAASKKMAIVCCATRDSKGMLTEIEFIGESDFAVNELFYMQELANLMRVLNPNLNDKDLDDVFGSMGLLKQDSFSATITSKVPRNGVTYELVYVPDHPWIFKITPSAE